MSDIVDQILVAQGGLNYDDDPRMFGKGDTDYRLNVIPTSLGSQFVLTNMKGTTKKSHSFTHHGDYDGATYTPLGSCYDIKRNAVYYFVYSDLDNHCIIRYNIDEDTFDKIVWENSNIGLDIDYPITDAFMIDDWLYWNPRSSSPRAINVQWAYYDYVSYSTKYTSGTATTTSTSKLVDSAQSFLSNVAVGMTVYNITDDTSETITAIDSDTTLSLSAQLIVFQEEYAIYKTSFSVGDYVKDAWNRVYVCIQDWTSGIAEPAEETNYFTFVTWCYNDVYSLSVVNAGQLYRQRAFFNSTPSVNARMQYEVGADTAKQFNNIRNNVFQFSYRYYIPDLGYTVSAPFTQAIGSFDNETYNGEYSTDIIIDNKITLTVGALKIDGDESNNDFLFDHVEMLVRSADDSNWKTLYRIPHSQIVKDGNAYAEHVFYNDKGLSVLDNAAIEKPYNFLPRSSNSQVALDGERSGYAGITEGYDIPPIDVDLSYDYEEVEYAQVTTSGSAAASITFTATVEWGAREDDPAYFYTTSTLTTSATWEGHALVATVNGQKYYYILTSDDVDTAAHFAEAVVKVLLLANIDSAVISSNRVQTEYFIEPQSILVERYIDTAVNAATTSIKHRTLKGGAWHSYCLYYWDGLLRRSEAIPIDPMYVKFIAEERRARYGTGYIRNATYTINHDAPSWAAWWGFGYAGNASVLSFWQYNIAAAGVSAAGDERDDLSYVDISPLQGIADDSALDLNFPNTNIEPYEFRKGDRIRFVTKAASGALGNSQLALDDWNVVVHDYEITDFDPTTNYVYFNSYDTVTSDYEIDAAYNDPSVIVELYRPKKSGNEVVYYETGGRRPVTGTGPAKVHSNATGILDDGDCYLITRTFSKVPTGSWGADTDPVFVESYSWSDFYDSEMWSKGKAGAAFGIGEKQLNNIRYSNKLSKNTLSSGLGSFDGLDYLTMSYNYGDITAARQIGQTLKVLFENNVASVLVNRTQFYDADGQSQVVKSDQVLGSINYSDEAWGCVNPESVLVVDRHLYFFDLRRKAYVRNASNGSFPISDYKMIKYFIDKSDALLDSGEEYINVRSAWDDDRGILHVGFEDLYNQSNNEVVMFLEGSNRWIGFNTLTRDKFLYNQLLFANDASLGTSPDFSLTATVGSITRQQVDVTALSGGSFTGSTSFDWTNSVNVYPGDVVYISFYSQTAGADATTNDITYLYVDFPNESGQDKSAKSSLYVGELNAYTSSVNITTAGTVRSRVVMQGSSVSITSGSVSRMQVTIYIARNILPVFASTPSMLAAFDDQDVYIINDNDTRCRFFGTQQSYAIRVYSTEAANIIKRYDAIALHTNKRWDISDIQIPATLNYPYGMQSKIPSGRFTKNEGVLKSDYLCNMKSTSSTANITDLLNGDRLRGYYLYQDLDGSETTEHTLYKVDVLSTQSKS